MSLERVAWLYSGEPYFTGKKWKEWVEVTTSEHLAKYKDSKAVPLIKESKELAEMIDLLIKTALAEGIYESDKDTLWNASNAVAWLIDYVYEGKEIPEPGYEPK